MFVYEASFAERWLPGVSCQQRTGGAACTETRGPALSDLDIVLPGISGFELCRYIRAQEAWRTLPIIMVSTKNSSSDRFWAMRQGANQYLPKPFKKEELIKIVMEVLLASVPDVSRASTATPRGNGPVPPHTMGRTFSTAPSESIEDVNLSHGMTGPRSDVNPGDTGPISSTNMPGANWNGANAGNAQFSQTNTSQDRMTPGTRNAQFSQTNTPRNNNGPGPSNGLPSRPQPRSFADAGPPHPVGQQSLYALSKFVPRRIDAPDLLWSNSPEVLAISDRRARQFYMVIDGQKNVEALTATIQMNRDEIIASLRFLLSQQHIHLYEPGGRLFDSSLFDSLLI